MLLEALDAPEKNEAAARHLKDAIRAVRVPMVRVCVGVTCVCEWVDICHMLLCGHVCPACPGLKGR